MRAIRSFVVLCVLSSAALVAVPGSAQAATTSQLEAQAAARLLNVINNKRAAAGLVRLVSNGQLRRLSKAHTKYLANNRYDLDQSIAHDGFNARATAVFNNNDGTSSICENVAFHTNSNDIGAVARKFFQQWNNSTSGHHECMFDKDPPGINGPQDATIGGVGIEKRATRWYATFLAVEDSSPNG